MTDIKKPFTMPYIAIDPCSSKSNQLNKQNIEMMHSMIDMYWDRKGAQSLALSLVHLQEERIIGVFVHLINTSWVNLSLPSYSHCSARYRKDESSCCSNFSKVPNLTALLLSRQFKQWWQIYKSVHVVLQPRYLVSLVIGFKGSSTSSLLAGHVLDDLLKCSCQMRSSFYLVLLLNEATQSFKGTLCFLEKDLNFLSPTQTDTGIQSNLWGHFLTEIIFRHS